jgi:hypothetical protein
MPATKSGSLRLLGTVLIWVLLFSGLNLTVAYSYNLLIY